MNALNLARRIDAASGLGRLLRFVYHRLQVRYWRIRGTCRLWRLRRCRDGLSLELGAGSKPGCKPWVTVDMNGCCDIYHDLADGIPFPDRSVDRIYSSHFFEHLTREQANTCLDECLRVLKAGGEFSIAVPNARLFVDAYLGVPLAHCSFEVNTNMDYLTYIAYCNGQHKMIFDMDSLCHWLTSRGFVHVSARAHDPELDLDCRRWQTIYAVGFKPYPTAV